MNDLTLKQISTIVTDRFNELDFKGCHFSSLKIGYSFEPNKEQVNISVKVFCSAINEEDWLTQDSINCTDDIDTFNFILEHWVNKIKREYASFLKQQQQKLF